MADKIEQNIIGEKEKETSFEKDSEKKLAPIVKETPPKEFKIMRAISNKYPQIEGELFQALSKKDVSFSEDTLIAFCIAVGQKLYKDSYATGRKDLNIGRAVTEDDKVTINITFSEMVENGFGITAGKGRHKDELKALIEHLHKTPLYSLDSDGSGKGKYLMNIEEWSIEKYGAKAVKLRLDKVFSNHLEGYGKFPEHIMKHLVTAVAAAGQKVTPIHKKLLLRLGTQNRNKPHIEPILDLMKYLGKLDEYRKNPKRALNSLFKALDIFKAKPLEMITGYAPYREKNLIIFFKKEQPLFEGNSEAE